MSLIAAGHVSGMSGRFPAITAVFRDIIFNSSKYPLLAYLERVEARTLRV